MRRANYFALAPIPGRAGRKNSRTGHTNMATMKPTTPLLAPKQGTTETSITSAPKNCTKNANLHQQRRRRFQSHTGTSKQRRPRFHTTGPPRLQHTRTVPGGREGPGCGARGWQGLAGLRADAPRSHQHVRRRWCGGRRRDRRARAGFEARRRTK